MAQSKNPSRPTPGSRLEELREERLLSLSAFARHVGVTRQAYQAWAKGLNLPKGEHLQTIAANFDVTPGWILCVEGEPKHRAMTGKESIEDIVAAYVATELSSRARGEPFWQSFVSYWRVDGKAVLRLAVERELELLKQATTGLDEFVERARELLEQNPRLPDITGIPLEWPTKGESPAKRKQRQSQRDRQIAALVFELRDTYRLAEFARRINQPEPSALVYVPPAREVEPQ
jgi:transcriptional regulator with XRE-family HTH domain